MRDFAVFILNRIFYSLSFLMPRDKKLWVFIGWRKSKEREVFAENVKYQFLDVAQNAKEVRAIWLGMDDKICTLLRKHGFEAHKQNTLRGIYYALRAGYTLIGAFPRQQNWRLFGRTRVIQLWHGKSLKKTGYESPYAFGRYNRSISQSIFHRPFRFVAMSTFFASYVMSDFHVPRNRILAVGLPKHDPLFRTVPGAEIDADQGFKEAISLAKGKNPRRLILYGPTFRPDGSFPLESVNLPEMDKILAEQNDQMIVTMHPKFSVKDWRPGNLENITFCQNDHDIYPFLNSFDLIVSDYSSLSIEFTMMGKPAILFAFDIEEYRNGMGIYEELWDLMPGPKVYSFSELLSALDKDISPYLPFYEEARQKMFTFFDGRAGERITKAILSLP